MGCIQPIAEVPMASLTRSYTRRARIQVVVGIKRADERKIRDRTVVDMYLDLRAITVCIADVDFNLSGRAV
jgi:hypothetical protein